MTDSKLDAALTYAKEGFAVFPLKADGKTPLTKHGHKDATTDEAQIRAWWTNEPNANIGLPLSSFVVIDVESVEGHGVNGYETLAKLEKKYGSLRSHRENEFDVDVYMVRTASGGAHFYFSYPDVSAGMLKKAIGDGIELKSNGYVVAPPSVVNGEDYYAKRGFFSIFTEMPAKWQKLCIKETPSREDWERVRPQGSGPSICEQHGISMSDVLTLPPNARKAGDGYLIKHPIHGATGGGNLFVNPSLNLWCCYRHDTGGDPLTWVAVRERFISCEDAGPLDAETALKCKDILRRDGLITDQEEGREPAQPKTNDGLNCAPRSAWFDGDMSSVTIYLNGKPVLKPLPEIVPVVVMDGPKTIEELLGTFHQHLYFEEDYNVTGPVCAFLSNFTSQDPGIVGIVGPSGSIKTEMIRSFGEVQNQFCYPISSITENTLISGMDKNIDTIPLLRGRVLTIKDLTTLLSKNDDIRSAIFADFREVTDGFIHKEFGNGVKKE
ncbi:MAG: bifunctional DNA primase/polymerase, partial [Euryarchaeota archaeon]